MRQISSLKMEMYLGIFNEMGFIRRKSIENNFNIPYLTNEEKMGGSKKLSNLTKVTQLGNSKLEFKPSLPNIKAKILFTFLHCL